MAIRTFAADDESSLTANLATAFFREFTGTVIFAFVFSLWIWNVQLTAQPNSFLGSIIIGAGFAVGLVPAAVIGYNMNIGVSLMQLFFPGGKDGSRLKLQFLWPIAAGQAVGFTVGPLLAAAMPLPRAFSVTSIVPAPATKLVTTTVQSAGDLFVNEYVAGVLFFAAVAIFLLNKDTKKYAFLLIPLMLGVVIALFAAVSGGSINGFRGLVPALLSGVHTHMWTYFLSNCAAGLTVGVVVAVVTSFARSDKVDPDPVS